MPGLYLVERPPNVLQVHRVTACEGVINLACNLTRDICMLGCKKTENCLTVLLCVGVYSQNNGADALYESILPSNGRSLQWLNLSCDPQGQGENAADVTLVRWEAAKARVKPGVGFVTS